VGASREWLRKEQRILALLHGPEPDYDQAARLLDEMAAAPGAGKVCNMAALYSELADAYSGAGRLEEAIVDQGPGAGAEVAPVFTSKKLVVVC